MISGDTGAKGDTGLKGDKGDKGDAFTYEDFTPQQLEDLTGPQGERGPQGETGPQGPQGPQGIQGEPGASYDDTEVRDLIAQLLNNKVDRAGDTMTGELNIYTDSGNAMLHTKRTDTSTNISFGVGSNRVNRGIYDGTNNLWVVYRDANHTYLQSDGHNIYFRPNADGTNLSYQASDGTWHMGGTILPSSNLSYNLGTPNYAFNRLYVNNIYAKGMGGDIISGSNASNLYIGTGSELSGKTTNIRGNTVRLYSHTSGAVYLGYSGSTAVTSDENLKDIYDLDDKYFNFFMNLKPVTYIYKDKGHRNHIGFGARQVENALIDAGLTTEQFAGILIDKDVIITADEAGTEEDVHYDELYSLRYEEFVALNTAVIQKQQDEIENLKHEILELKNLIKNI